MHSFQQTLCINLCINRLSTDSGIVFINILWKTVDNHVTQ